MGTRTRIISFGILSASLALSAQANDVVLANKDQSKSLYHIYMGALYNQPDRDRSLTDFGYGFTAGWGIPLRAISNNLYMELGGSRTTYRTGRALNASGESVRLPVDFYRTALTADLQYAFGDRDSLTPFILGGIGVARTDVGENRDDKTHFTASLGAGLTGLMIGELVRGRVDVRGIYDDYSRGLFDAVLTAGIEIPLGRHKSEPIIQMVERQVEVEREVVREIVKEVEPLDSDGDGIPDHRDDCPGTLPGLRTDNRGCAIGQTVTIENIEFDFNKATLRDSSGSILDNAANFLRNQDNLRVVIAGHTDDVGSDIYNQRLSEARARSVMQALVQRGISADRLKALGLGKSFPRASNATQEGRDRNRRVEFLLSAADRPETKVNQQVPEAPVTIEQAN